jgi:glycosyltransferase involved in cell wall biosynthesis
MIIGLVPVFNEEKNVIAVLEKLERRVDYIVIVNDGSMDNTDFLVSNWRKKRNNIHYISLKKNRGMSYALLQGFYFIVEKHRKGEFLKKDVVVTIDADGQHNPDEISNIHKYFEENNLEVLIARRDFTHYPVYRIIGNKVVSLIISLMAKFKFRDIECGLKMFRISFIANLLHYYLGFKYSCAAEIGIIAARLGYKIDNNYKITVPYYEQGGPKLIDLFFNLLFSLLLTLKINLKKDRRLK